MHECCQLRYALPGGALCSLQGQKAWGPERSGCLVTRYTHTHAHTRTHTHSHEHRAPGSHCAQEPSFPTSLRSLISASETGCHSSALGGKPWQVGGPAPDLFQPFPPSPLWAETRMAGLRQEWPGGPSPSQQICRGKSSSLSGGDSRRGLATAQLLNPALDCARHRFPGLPRNSQVLSPSDHLTLAFWETLLWTGPRPSWPLGT